MKSPPLIVLGFMLFILTFLFVGMPVSRPVEPPVQEKDGSGPAEVKREMRLPSATQGFAKT